MSETADVTAELIAREPILHLREFVYDQASLEQAGRPSRRATIWDRRGGPWRMAYHQGTIIEDASS